MSILKKKPSENTAQNQITKPLISRLLHIVNSRLNILEAHMLCVKYFPFVIQVPILDIKYCYLLRTRVLYP